MATDPGQKPTWDEIGRSVSTAVSNLKRREVKVDDYYVVVGFEVNNPAAFVGDIHDLGVDYGHAFFYVVKNLLVEKVLSFGPAGAGKVGWFNQGSNESPNWANTGAVLKDGYQNSRLGTPDYGITELVTAFKVPVDLSTGLRVVKETDAMRLLIISGKQRYTAYMNDTCAETARDVLESAGVKTPSGSGIVRHSGLGIATARDVDTRFGKLRLGFTAVNPYMWHKNFKATSFATNTYMPPVDPATGGHWKVPVGVADPIFG